MNTVFVPKEELAAYEMRRDIEYRHIPEESKQIFVDYAWEKGRETAVRIAKKYPGKIPSEIAAALNLKVTEARVGNKVYSEYYSNRKQIVLNPDSIQKGFYEENEGHLKTHDYEVLKQLFIAHELFHHLECYDPEVGITFREKKVCVFKIGPIQLKSGLRCLSEIAAHSFTKQLLNIDDLY